MTLLHYASKSGAPGIGNEDTAAEVVTMLLSKGADPNIRCRWTNMTALHYAVYFDVVPVIKILLKATKALGRHAELSGNSLVSYQGFLIFRLPSAKTDPLIINFSIV